MDFTISNEFRFSPWAYGNNEAAEPVTFICRYLTDPERTAFMPTKYDGNYKAVIEIDKLAIFRASVKKIENFKINGESIETAKEYLQKVTGLSLFFDQVVEHIIVRCIKGDLKN